MSNRSLTGFEAFTVIVFSIVLVLLVVAGIAALGALILAWAWNAFMPSVFGLPHITFMQAFALTFLIGSIKGLLSVQIKRKNDNE